MQSQVYVLIQATDRRSQSDLTSDITQEVWLEVVDEFSEGKLLFLHYGLLILKADQTIVDQRRKNSHLVPFDIRLHDKATRTDIDVNDRIELKQMISDLPPEQANILKLQIEGYTQDEIGESLNLHRSTVRRTIKSAVEKMRVGLG